jgi:hypothetical protein
MQPHGAKFAAADAAKIQFVSFSWPRDRCDVLEPSRRGADRLNQLVLLAGPLLRRRRGASVIVILRERR